MTETMELICRLRLKMNTFIIKVHLYLNLSNYIIKKSKFITQFSIDNSPCQIFTSKVNVVRITRVKMFCRTRPCRSDSVTKESGFSQVRSLAVFLF